MGWGGSSTRRGGDRKARSLPRSFVFLGSQWDGNWDVPGILQGRPGPAGVFKDSAAKSSSCSSCGPYRRGPFLEGFSKLFCRRFSEGFSQAVLQGLSVRIRECWLDRRRFESADAPVGALDGRKRAF